MRIDFTLLTLVNRFLAFSLESKTVFKSVIAVLQGYAPLANKICVISKWFSSIDKINGVLYKISIPSTSEWYYKSNSTNST